ncbi:MAG: hypothetical protein ACKO1M_11970, partial [Planctomycetota bacterium]
GGLGELGSALSSGGDLPSGASTTRDVARGTAAAIKTVEALQRELGTGLASLDSAVSTTARLADLATTLAARGGDADRAADGLDGLVTLQQGLVRSVGDLQAADAALVRLGDLAGSLADASGTVGQLQRFVVDVMLLEPAIVRAVRALEPVTEFTRAGRRVEVNKVNAKARVEAEKTTAVESEKVTEVAQVIVDEEPEASAEDAVGY